MRFQTLINRRTLNAPITQLVLPALLIAFGVMEGNASQVVFSDNFESGNLNSWTVTSTTPNPLVIATPTNRIPVDGSFSAYMDVSTDRMHRNLITDNGGSEISGHLVFTSWFYDAGANSGTVGATRLYNEIRGYSAGTGLPNGGTTASGTLAQLMAVGKFNSTTLPGDTFTATKYQGRVAFGPGAGGSTGWFNLNGPGSPNRSIGWHRFDIEVLADSTTVNFYVDGILSRTFSGADPVTIDTLILGPGLGTQLGDAWVDGVSVMTGTPVITTQPQSQTVAPGASITFNVADVGGFTYQWKHNGVDIVGATGSSHALSSVSGVNNGEYTVVVGNGAGTTTSSVATLIVSPSIVVQPVSKTNCVGTAAQFAVTAAGAAPLSYQWYYNDTTLLTDETNATLAFSSVQTPQAGNYSVVITNIDGAVTSVVASLVVNVNPTVTVNSTTICEGGMATLTASTAVANPGYLWSPGGATSSAITVSPVATTIYTVTVTDLDTGCSVAGSGTITVNPRPTLAVNSAGICAGSSATLTAITSAANPSYLWSPGGDTASSIMVSPASTTIYTVTVTDGTTGCANTSSGTVTVTPVPTVTVNSETICEGRSATLTATTSAATPNYLWSPGGATTASIMVSPTATTTYTVTVTDGAATCPNTASGTVTVIPVAPVTVNSQTICAGASATLTATTAAANPSYSWSPGNATTASITVSPASTTVYTVTVTDGTTACTASGSGTVTVNPLPTVAVNSATICPGDSATLTATTTATSPTYLWSPGGETSASITVSPASTTVYSVTVTDGAGCSGSGSSSGTVTVKQPVTFANTGAVSINDNGAASPYPSVISVSGLTATVCRVTVTLNNLSHPFPDDIDIVLVGPNGQGVLLMSDVGNADSLSGVTLNFDDSASLSLPDAGAIGSGSYKPTNYGAKEDGRPDNFPAPAPATRFGTNLSAFAGINPNGNWSLYVVDDEAVDFGTIAGGWSVALTTLTPFADVSVAQASIPNPVAAGSNLTFSVTVTNNGPAGAENISLIDTLPAGVTFVSAVSSQGSCTPGVGTVSCTLGSLLAGNSATVNIVVVPAANSIIANAATVTSTTLDFVSANNASSASVTVLDAPVITLQPLAQTVCANGAISLAVTATGSAPLSYQWSKDNVAIGGATSATLNIGSAAVGNSGTYTVVVANSVGAAVSSGAAVTVNPLPTVAVNSQTICLGGSAILTATTSAANATYLWSPGALTSASITVNPASTTIYTVLVTDGVTGCTNSASGTVTVNPLTIASAIQSYTNVCPGTAVTFSTVAGGTPPFTYEWRKGGVAIGGATTDTLSLPSVVLADSGTYSVVVSGTCGAVTNSGTLSVVAPPTITSQPVNQTTPMGNGAVFTVAASSVVASNIQWQLNGVDIVGANTTSLAVSNVTLSQNGSLYRAVISNCGGSTTSLAAALTVTPVSGISFDFNTPGQYTNAPYYLTYNNWINGGYLPSALITPTMYEFPIGGVGPYPGSGSLDMAVNNGNENTSVLLPVSFDFSLPGKTLYVSTMFKLKNPVANGRSTQIGFVTATNSGINDVAGQGFLTMILQSIAQPVPTYDIRMQRRLSGGGLHESTPLASGATLIVSNWYQYRVKFENTKGTGTASSNFTVSASLQDMGPLGTTPGATNLSVVNSSSASGTNFFADITSFKNVYLAIRGVENSGIEFRDNTYAWTTPGNIAFVQPPQNQTVNKGSRAVFGAYVDGEGPYTYVWQRGDGSGGFTNIPLAGSWNYITPPARTSDNGAQIRVVVTGPANTITSAPATLTVTPQSLAVVSAGSVDGTTVGVLFNQPVDPVSAEIESNYSINGVAPAQARVYRTSLGAQGPDGIYVVLTPATVLSGSFTVTVSGVTDLSGGGVSAANSAAGSVAGLAGFDVNPDQTGPPGENYSFGPGKFIITGGGSDIAGNGDGFRFVYTTRTGDFDIVTRIPYMDTIRFVSKAGFDARISLDPFSPMVVAAFNPGPMAEGSGTLRQFSEGNVRNTWNIGTGGWGNNTRMFHPDVWLRLRRSGNTFIRYSSTNGVNWLFDGQTSPTTVFPPTIYVGLAVSSVRNLFAESALFESYGDFAGYPGSTITINTQPTNITVAASSAATIGGLTATVSGGGVPGGGERTFVWQRNDGSGGWTNMPTAGATNNLLSVGTVFGADNGAQFRAVITSPGALSVTSSVAVLTVTDTALPTVASVNSTILPSYPVSEVTINFSEPMSAATATDLANYAVTNAAGVRLTVLSAAFLGSDLRTIILKVDGQLGVGNASVGISGVRDQNNNLLANTVRTFRSFLPSTAPVVVEVYQDVGAGTAVTDLTGNALFTGGTPTFICYSNTFGFNVGLGGIQDNYGVKVYTYFVPPTNGNYKFWIRTDDAGQLFMNTTGTNPVGKVLIAENTAFNATYSVGAVPANSITNIPLVGGQSYYMELVGKEGTGGDGFSVMWTDTTNGVAPAATVFMPTTALAYPTAVAPSTPVVMDIYTGYQNFLAGFNQMVGLTQATNFPTSTYALDVINFKYISGLADVIGYQKYFGVQPSTLGNTRLDNYLGRIQSYFVAPSNGLYRFWMGVDDVAQLYMNTNAVNSTDPAGMVRLGQSANAFVSTASQLVAQNVPLVGGQQYYMMALWREGGGGDGIRIAVRSQGDTAAPPVGEVIPASMLRYPLAVGRAGAVNIWGIAPASPTVVDGRSLTLSAAGISGAAPYGGITWFKNGVKIAENTFTNITPPLTMADNGSVYTVVVTNLFSRAEKSTTLTVLPDGTAPTIVRTVGRRDNDGFTIVFSEPVNPVTATYLGNYQISGGIALLSAVLDPARTMLSIMTSPQAAATTYTVTVNGVRDASSTGNMIAANTTTTFSTWSIGGSGFMVELFTNLSGTLISDMTGAPKFAANLPDVVYYTNVFGAGLFALNSGLENYGARVSGYFIPSNTGFYRFHVRSDDSSQLWMNINSTDSANPAGRTMLVHNINANLNINDPKSMSVPLPLNQGQAYYIEALMKEGGGGDYVQVTYRQTDAAGTSLTAVPVDNAVGENSTIASFGGSGVPGNPDAIQILQVPPSELFLQENDPVSLSLVASIPANVLPASSYQWQRFSGVTFTNIPGATAATFNFFAALADDNVQYRLIFSAPGRNATYLTRLHVARDLIAPYVVSASSLDGREINLCFNERVTALSGADAFNYTVNGGGVSVLNAALRADGKSVILSLDNPVVGQFTVDTFSIVDLASIENTGNSSTNGYVQGFMPFDVGAPAGIGSSFSCVPGEIDVVAGGADIWGASDQGHLTLTARYGDFDIYARVQSLSRAVGDTDNVNKAGIMVRESTNATSRTIHLLVNSPTAIGGRDQGETGQRINTGAATALFAGSAAYNPATGVPAGIPNAWVRIKRVGDVFTSFQSYDGVNWVTVASGGFTLPDPVLIGLATTAHVPAPSASTSLAEYRNIHIPNTPTILIQPSPASQTVAVHGTVTYSVTASNPPNSGPLTYQWRKDGFKVPGATGATLTLNDLQTAQSGVYTVWVGNDGGATISGAVTLTVNNALPLAATDTLSTPQDVALATPVSALLANDTDANGDTVSILAVSGLQPAGFFSDFNNGLPTGAAIFGNATAETSGGAAGSGYLRLNPSVINQAGALVLDELTPRRRVSAFTASFKLRISEGSDQPADGFSFNFGSDLTIGTSGGAENGVGTGLSFCVDNYQFAPYPAGGNANTSGLKLRYGGVDIAGVQTGTWDRDAFVPVTVSVDAQGSVKVFVDGTNVFGNVVVPWVARTGRFGFYARTGGQRQGHAIDDLNIALVNTVETAREASLGGSIFGNAYVDSGFLHLNDAAAGLAGSFVLNELTPGVPITSFNATFKLRIGNGSGEPADGFSFNFANDLPLTATTPLAAENGAGTGFSFCVDNYQFAPYPAGATPNTSGMKIRLGGVDIAGVQTPTWNSTAFIPVSITITSGGVLTVLVNGTNVFGNLTLPIAPTIGRFGLYARTGGQFQTHWVDDLSINVTTAGSPASFNNNFNSTGFGTVVLANNVVTYTPPGGACGTDTYYYLATDGQAGSVSVGTVNVNLTVPNPQPPVILGCPASRTIEATANCQAAIPDLTTGLSASDCATFVVRQSPASGTLAGLGANVVTLTVSNSYGLISTCQSTVTVVDTQAPLLVSCAAPAILSAGVNCSAALTDLRSQMIVSDACAVTVTQLPAPGTVLPLGNTTVTLTATDVSGNSTNCQTIVTVIDATAPAIVCPADIVVACSGANGATVNFVVTALDSCDANPVVTSLPASGSTFAIGTNIVTSKAVDAAGNTNTCTFRVIVQDSPVPTMTIVRQGANAVITWPQTCTPYVLEETAVLGTGISWSLSTATIESVGGNYRAIVPATGDKFYRLKKQP